MPEKSKILPENYTPERKAEFLLMNAVNAQDYRRAREEVRKMGWTQTRSRCPSPGGKIKRAPGKALTAPAVTCP